MKINFSSVDENEKKLSEAGCFNYLFCSFDLIAYIVAFIKEKRKRIQRKSFYKPELIKI